MYPNPIIMMGLQNLVEIIRKNKTSPREIFRAYAVEEEGFFRIPATIPALIFILQEIQIWTYVCLACLILSRTCQRVKANDATLQAAIQAVLLAYKPNKTIDDGMTEAAKTLSLATLGYKPAVEAIRANAQINGFKDTMEYGNALFSKVIMTIASRPDEKF
jgi:hypothetical protein